MFSSTPLLTPNFSASKEKNSLLFVGDIHTDIGPVQLLTESLPELCKAGYNVLFIESPPKPKECAQYSTIDFLIYSSHYFIERLETLLALFPSVTVPVENERTDNQRQFITKEANDHKLEESEVVSMLNNELKLDKNRLPYLRKKLEMLQIVKKLEIDVFCVDVEFPENEDIKTRNDTMLTNISKNLIGKKQGIVFCGIAHCMDVWEKGMFYRGIISSVLEKQNIEFQGCFCSYSDRENSDVKESIKRRSMCSDNIIFHIQLASAQEITSKSLLAGSIKNVSTEKELSKIQKYFIPKLLEENDNIQTKKYVGYLGGKIVENKMRYRGKDLMAVEMRSSVLKKERREKCLIDRVRVVKLNKRGIDALEKISPITIEDDLLSDGSEAHLITFPLTLMTKKDIDRVASEKINQLVAKKPLDLKV